jgi:hypothetical protein
MEVQETVVAILTPVRSDSQEGAGNCFEDTLFMRSMHNTVSASATDVFPGLGHGGAQ